mmetsp:Transcript_5223/g.16578  ORF Transcript_5223/g.16578 Transcript_5223/m.16578 type:complete len:447 (+) Transcript_5223:129-1469(+)
MFEAVSPPASSMLHGHRLERRFVHLVAARQRRHGPALRPGALAVPGSGTVGAFLGSGGRLRRALPRGADGLGRDEAADDALGEHRDDVGDVARHRVAAAVRALAVDTDGGRRAVLVDVGVQLVDAAREAACDGVIQVLHVRVRVDAAERDGDGGRREAGLVVGLGVVERVGELREVPAAAFEVLQVRRLEEVGEATLLGIVVKQELDVGGAPGAVAAGGDDELFHVGVRALDARVDERRRQLRLRQRRRRPRGAVVAAAVLRGIGVVGGVRAAVGGGTHEVPPHLRDDLLHVDEDGLVDEPEDEPAREADEGIVRVPRHRVVHVVREDVGRDAAVGRLVGEELRHEHVPRRAGLHPLPRHPQGSHERLHLVAAVLEVRHLADALEVPGDGRVEAELREPLGTHSRGEVLRLQVVRRREVGVRRERLPGRERHLVVAVARPEHLLQR